MNEYGNPAAFDPNNLCIFSIKKAVKDYIEYLHDEVGLDGNFIITKVEIHNIKTR